MTLEEVRNLRRKILMISLLVTLLLLPLVVTAGEKPDKPGKPSGSELTLNEDVIGTLYSQNTPTSRRIEADGTLAFVPLKFGNLKSKSGMILDFTGEHDGHLRIDLSPRRDTAYFDFRYSEDIDGDDIDDHILLHNPTAFGGDRIVEITGKDYVKITFNGKFELWVAYKDEEGNYRYGEAWFPYLTIIVDIQKVP